MPPSLSDTPLLSAPAPIPRPSNWESPAPAVKLAGSFGPGLCCPQAVLLGTARVREMASQSQGIQQLLQAEKRAAEKVADARKRKARRLKQAKEEAQMEVEQYRREREQEFQSKQQAAMGSQGNLSAEVEQATRRQVQGMQSSQQRSRERVLAQLLGMVCDVRPQVHPNYRIAA
ncbi:V-type proton ATPase subunit G 2 isoform X1 [Physeter macrocephalus]|uniref:V-type proton ATPase subunit G n=11 Tax=Cetacea TaxID=9721 RepID=A0A455AHH7_PHYMC|nr:V-type proton ATPase subunit G 2 isoform X1 [Physeter catodon]|eukprot:XP_028335029.1 V-type proton ATPase subunit G 2 isoform X1 [Physeter catodon]